MATPLDIVIVSYNTCEDTLRCLRSIHDAAPKGLGRVWVVDNASTDGSVGAVRTAFPSVQVVALDRNVGFGAANNVALRQATAPLLLFLNSDTVAPPGAIDALVERLEATGVVAAGPKLIDRDGRPEVSFGPMLSPVAEAVQSLRVRAASRGAAVARRYIDRLVGREREVDWVTAACLLVRRDSALAAGGFDERFFLYEEDVDLCASLRDRGGRILFTPRAVITHLRGQSGGASAHVRSQPPRVLRKTPAGVGPLAEAVAAGPRPIDPVRSAGIRRVRIAIDARKLHDYGIGTYVRNLVRALARQQTDDVYVLLCRRADREFVTSLGPRFEALVEEAGNYSVREQISVPVGLWRARVDLFHAPHYVVSPLTLCPFVVTIHDCIHLRFPQYLPNRAAYVYARTVMSSSARRARRVLTVSQASKQDILHFLKIRADKIEVIYNGLDERLAVEPPPDEIARVQQRFQLTSPFVLYAGNIKPHKNVDRLIEAFSLLRQQGMVDAKLLIIGDAISKYPNLRRLVHRHQLHQHVRFLGFVSDEMLAVLYRLASVFVFPSLYEGFGLPPLEAMAAGAPVITSNVSSLPEVVGDAALLINPLDPQDIATAMARVLGDARLRADLIRRGHERVRAFSWDVSAAQTYAAYTELIRRPAHA